jgi:hypothetical protein
MPRFSPDLLRLLEVSLPSRQQTMILRAALLNQAEGINEWDEAIDNPRAGVNRFLPLLNRAIRSQQFPVSPGLRTHLAAASIREQARTGVVRQLCAQALKQLRQHGISVIVLKGVAAAETVYPGPELRHCHDLDLLVAPQDLSAAVDALTARVHSKVGSSADVSWAPASRSLRSDVFSGREFIDRIPSQATLHHASGFPVCLHTSLFPIKPFAAAIPEPFACAVSAVIAGEETLVLRPSAGLLHTVAHAATFGSGTAQCWVPDAWFQMARHEIDWTWIEDRATAGQMAGPLLVLFEFLSRQFAAPVPARLLSSLQKTVVGSGATATLAAKVCLLTSVRGHPKDLLNQAPDARTRFQLARWLLLPPPQYLTWIEGSASSVNLPSYYVSRISKFLIRSLHLPA